MDGTLRYIAVEGLIGSGKTALAGRLAQRLKARLVVEDVEANPYLEKFYQDIRGFAFQTQLFFLFARYKQQAELRQASMFEPRVVSDYLFEKDRIFAYLNLNDFEISLYERVYSALVKEVVRPDLVVYLQARRETIQERIRKRGRAYESAITEDYLEALSDAYNKFFLRYDGAPLLIVHTDELNLAESQEDFDNLFREIMAGTQGRRFYSPARTPTRKSRR